MIVPILRVWDETQQAYVSVPAIKGDSVPVPMELEEIDLATAGLPAVTEGTVVSVSMDAAGELAAAWNRAMASGAVRLRFLSGCPWQNPLDGTAQEPDGTTTTAVALVGGQTLAALVGNRIFYFGRTADGGLGAAVRSLWADA